MDSPNTYNPNDPANSAEGVLFRVRQILRTPEGASITQHAQFVMDQLNELVHG